MKKKAALYVWPVGLSASHSRDTTPYYPSSHVYGVLVRSYFIVAVCLSSPYIRNYIRSTSYILQGLWLAEIGGGRVAVLTCAFGPRHCHALPSFSPRQKQPRLRRRVWYGVLQSSLLLSLTEYYHCYCLILHLTQFSLCSRIRIVVDVSGSVSASVSFWAARSGRGQQRRCPIMCFRSAPCPLLRSLHPRSLGHRLPGLASNLRTCIPTLEAPSPTSCR
jgi:hypothetical protein